MQVAFDADFTMQPHSDQDDYSPTPEDTFPYPQSLQWGDDNGGLSNFSLSLTSETGGQAEFGYGSDYPDLDVHPAEPTIPSSDAGFNIFEIQRNPDSSP